MNFNVCLRFMRKYQCMSSMYNLTRPNLDKILLYRQLNIPRQFESESLFYTLSKTPNLFSLCCYPNRSNCHQNLNIIDKNESRQSPLLTIVKEVFTLKNGRATSLVVENKLRSILFYYKAMTKEERNGFLKELADKYSINHNAILKTSQKISELESNSKMLMETESKLRNQLTPQYSWLFQSLGRLEHGVKFLVDLRQDTLVLLSSLDVQSPYQLKVQQLNNTLKELLSFWFSAGFLEIKRVTWSSPCKLLEKVAEYEAVHPVRSWRDLKQRIGAYRRCFVYTHHCIPGEPLVILHVALTKDIEHSMENIVHFNTGSGAETQSNTVKLEEDPNNIKAFIFYSISATQKGLQGIDLGNYLIKQAAKELHAENPQVKMFSTLSPIPSFRQWLVEKIKAAEKGNDILLSQVWEELLYSLNPNERIDAWAKIRSMLLDNSWFKDENLVKALKTPLMASCSQYLYLEKRRGFAYDSVAHFHLRNGAVMWRLNWLADTSPRGFTNSCGLMVNYRYYLDAADANSLKYIQERTVIASEQIMELATHTKRNK